ncbi:centrosomal protein of 162 kDa isoform X1 [Cololabis saira]|uniref:centrosomal protein of 162 kDa isoform X1 n=1 Tax=Cololabis saira TaxID=129043 RepID=UPI002AD51A07|nr:centrosomal protein of 162 kDa isoform X1 [Cololabis saira]
MSHRLTKEQLDAQFEQFLKESVSDDSVDLASPDKQRHVKSSQKTTASWWQDDQHSSGGTEEALAKRRFIKSKKPEPEIHKLVSEESVHKPVPKPRSKAPSKPAHFDKAPEAAALDLFQPVEIHKAPSKDSYSESVSSRAGGNLHSSDESRDSPGTAGGSLGERDDAPSESAASFRKSFRKSQPIQEDDEELGDAGLSRDAPETETESGRTRPWESAVPAAAGNVSSVGLDTLEEEEEKATFFAQFEAGASSSIDYSRLNRELDLSGFAVAPDLREAEEAARGQREDDPSQARGSQDSPDYSEDFEDEDDGEELDQKSKVCPSPAGESLLDSLGGAGGDDQRKETTGSLDRAGHSRAQSGGSEMEALQEAYRHIQTVDGPDEQHVSCLVARQKSSRPTSPSSPPRPASTTQSDLPTAEELMMPIRPETSHVRGFSLPSVSVPDPPQTPRSLDRTFRVDAPAESEQKQPGAADPASGTNGAPGLRSPPSQAPDPPNQAPDPPNQDLDPPNQDPDPPNQDLDPPNQDPDPPNQDLDPPNQDRTWSLREEVDRLMQDNKTHSSDSSSSVGRARNRPVSSRLKQAPGGPSVVPSFVRPAPSPGRRPAVVSGGGRTPARSSGSSRAAARGRGHSSVSQPPRQPPNTRPLKKSPEEGDRKSAELELKGGLAASVQSLVAVLQQQMDTSRQGGAQGGPEEPRPQQAPPQISKPEEKCEVEELRARLARRERELLLMEKEAEELKNLRQHNYLLQSKLQNAEEASQKRRWVEAADPGDKFKRMDKELTEQETLIKGYQQENEKLYLQVKAQQARNKENEEAMFKENQRLLAELTLTREQLRKPSQPAGGVCVGHVQRISDLLGQISVLQRKETELLEGNRRLNQQRQSVQVELQLMKKERDLARAQAVSSLGDKTFEIRVLEDKHKEEVAALKKKLQWFAENQDLLDRDASRLKAATAETHQLQEQVEKLKQEVGRRSSEQQKKPRDKSVDTKRIQDLERQVKELEQILRRRNPNSLPALICAAAAAAGPEQSGSAGSASASPGRVSALLERRVQHLEAELEGSSEEAKRCLRAMEQQFHRIKLRYEQQISDLEQQLQQKQQREAAAGSAPGQSQESSQEKESHSLQQQLNNKVQASPGRHQRPAEAAVGARLERLNQEPGTRTGCVQEPSCTGERLQKERRPDPRAEKRSAESRRRPGCTAAGGDTSAGGDTAAGPQAFPAAQYEKTYQPAVFSGSHISEVLQENEALQQRVELLLLQGEQEKEALRAEALQAQEELCRMKQHLLEQLSCVKAEHLRVLEGLRAAHALEHSASKVAELSNKLSSQEISMKHLQEQCKELQGSTEALALSKSREDALQRQLSRLLQELKDAKDCQSSEVKLLQNLENKMVNMELRHRHREEELTQVMGGSWQVSPDLQAEAERWRRLAQHRSRELEGFRLELDSILDILRHLQRTGGALPPAAPPAGPQAPGAGDGRTQADSSYRELC